MMALDTLMIAMELLQHNLVDDSWIMDIEIQIIIKTTVDTK